MAVNFSFPMHQSQILLSEIENVMMNEESARKDK